MAAAKPTRQREGTSIQALAHDAGGARLAHAYLHERWAAATGEQLHVSDPCATLLGDRRPHPREHEPQPIRHQEAFGLLHASVLHAIKRRFERTHKPAAAGESRAIIAHVRKIAQRALVAWWRRQRRDGRGADFHRAWVETGLAECTGGGAAPRLTILDEHRNVRPGAANVIMYTDGGGATPQQPKHAGWGCAIFDATTGTPAHELLLGRLADDAPSEDDRGITNNKAELRGLLAAARRALAKANTWRLANQMGGGGAKPVIAIHTDSTYGLLRAEGASGRGTRRPAHAGTIRKLRSTLIDARAILGHGAVRLLKIKAHSGHEGNEIADALADEGRNGATTASDATDARAQALKAT